MSDHSTMSITAQKPVSGIAETRTQTSGARRGRARFAAVDAARGVALLGMIAVHTLHPTNVDGSQNWMFALFNGRAAAAFAVLAGVGIAFMTGRRPVRRADAKPTIAMLATRAAVIGAIGLALGYTDPDRAWVILPAYAVLFLLAIPLVFLRSSIVAVTAVVVVVVVPVVIHATQPHLPRPELDNPTFGDLIDQPLSLLGELSLTGVYPALAWVSYVCAGLVIGRLSLERIKVAWALLGTGLGLATVAATGSDILLHDFGGLAEIQAAIPDSGLTAQDTTALLAVGGNGTTPTSTWWWLAVDAPHTSTPFDLVGTTGTTAILLGLMTLVDHLRPPAIQRTMAAGRVPLAAAGSITLTCYTAHIVFLNSDHYSPDEPVTGYIIQVAAVLLIGLYYRTTARRGPFEALTAHLARQARHRASLATSCRDRGSR